MFGLIFTALFTAVAIAMAVWTLASVGWAGALSWEGAIAFLFPVAGILVTRMAWRDWERIRSLRTEVEDGYIVYTWREDGEDRRSHVDPRPRWDAEERG
jgi:hypothetical protein